MLRDSKDADATRQTLGRLSRHSQGALEDCKDPKRPSKI